MSPDPVSEHSNFEPESPGDSDQGWFSTAISWLTGGSDEATTESEILPNSKTPDWDEMVNPLCLDKKILDMNPEKQKRALKKQYFKRSKKFHPDKCSAADEKACTGMFQQMVNQKDALEDILDSGKLSVSNVPEEFLPQDRCDDINNYS